MDVEVGFIGGPKDGQIRMLRELVPYFDFAIPQQLGFCESMTERESTTKPRIHRYTLIDPSLTEGTPFYLSENIS